MTIREDLSRAKANYGNYVSIRSAVRTIAANAGVTVVEGAQWLLYQRADSELPAYVRYKASFLVEEALRTDDKAGRRPYRAVRDYLTSLVLPEQRGIFALMQTISQWQQTVIPETEETVWLRKDLADFLSQYDVALDTTAADTSDGKPDPVGLPSVSIETVAKTFVIGKSVDESIAWWKNAARGAKDRPWLLSARTTKGRGGPNGIPATFDLYKIFTAMPESVMTERSRWHALQNNASELYAQYEAFDPRDENKS